MPPARHTDDSEFTLIARSIRRRIWIVAACFVFAILAAAVLTVTAEKEYSASSSLLLQAEDEPQRAVDTNLQLLSLPAVATTAADAMSGMTREEVEDAIETKQQGESDIVRIKATTTDPTRSADLANAFARAFVSFRKESGESSATGFVQLVERAIPKDSPVSPRPVRNVVLGALIGLIIGIGMALLLEQLDRRVKRKEDLIDAMGLPLLASIPRRQAFSGKQLGHGSLSPAEVELFRLLRTSLRHFKGIQDIKTILVTSAEAGEGKSLISVGLALAAATSGERVLLLEADLRDPSLGDVLGLSPGAGLAELLSGSGDSSLASLAVSVPARRLARMPGDNRFDVVTAGAIPQNPTQLVESARMKHLLAEAEARYDFIVVDTPPLFVASEAMPLIPVVDGVLAVCALGVSTRSSAADMTQQLERLGAPMLGVVANFTGDSASSLEGYGYGRPPELAPQS